MSTLMNKYKEEIRPQLQKELGYNLMAVPRIEKITLNMGVGKAATENKKIMAFAAADLTAIAGQKAQITKAKKSIAGFKIREGWPIGCMVTLRGKRMYDFLERFITIAAPRVRDFRGFKKKLDGRGNYSVGIREQIVFPEINFDKIDEIRGLNITITTTANNDDDARALLKAFNFPIKD